MARVELKREQYEFNTGWQKVVKSNDDVKNEELNQKFKKISEDIEEIKRQIEFIKTTFSEETRSVEDEEKYERIESTFLTLEGTINSLKSDFEVEIKNVNERLEEHKKNIDTQIGFMQETLKLIIARLDEPQKKSGGLGIFKR